MEAAPSDAELRAFIMRYEAALPDAAGDALAVHEEPAGIALGLSLGLAQQHAVRRALAPGSHTELRVITRYAVPRHLEQLATTVKDPQHRVREARQRSMDLAAKVARAKALAWTATAEVDRRALYEHLNAILTDAGDAVHALDALLRLEETTATAGPAVGGQDAIVGCPAAGVPVSCRWNCERCVWRGPWEASCYAPEARRMVVGAEDRGLLASPSAT